jgi:hypothetical protein
MSNQPVAQINVFQDKIQEKLTSLKVPEDVQDKVGNFALLVINKNFVTAKKVCIINKICIVSSLLKKNR